jgi:signal transduction histidine kinase/DNA-binding response OmpR family regulator
MTPDILRLAVSSEADVVTARQRARQLADLTGFEPQDQIRIATAVSEIARNAQQYAGGGEVRFRIEGQQAPQVLQIVVADHGRGIDELSDVLAGSYRSTTGLGIGLTGARRLMDTFSIESRPGRGTTVTMGKLLPQGRFVGARRLAEIGAALAAERPPKPIAEVQQQNRELLRALDDLRRRQEELERLNQELEDTNRGVVALYAELDERADHLRRADEMKTKFLSNMSHEFRTPLNSILALTRLLLDQADGPLTPEQDTQVSLVRKAAVDLSELVNDLLDLAKVEAGKIVIRPADVEVATLFGTLRGMLRPLLVTETVSLVFEPPEGIPTLYTDDSKVSQILRNFISNALKFTERGEVRVRAVHDRESGTVRVSVADTGIGIAPEDRERIFLEFTQLEHPLQAKVRGTGLGLPLSRRLAELLGGRIELESAPGRGSTFTLVLPLVYEEPRSGTEKTAPEAPDSHPGRLPVLVVEDQADELLVYDRCLRDSPYHLLAARTLREAREQLQRAVPAAVVLDVALKGEDTWKLLAELKSGDATAGVPVLVVSNVDEPRKGLALGADEYAVKPVNCGWLLARLDALVAARRQPTVLLIDDDAGARYVLRRHLTADGLSVIEADSGEAGLALARGEHPAAIVLDLLMPGMSGQEVLDALETGADTRTIPVVIATATHLTPGDREALSKRAAAILPKDLLAGDAAALYVRHVLAQAGIAPKNAR